LVLFCEVPLQGSTYMSAMSTVSLTAIVSLPIPVIPVYRYTGMLEAVRVRREGFAYRPFFSDFFNCYRALAYYFTDKVNGLCSTNQD